MVEAYKNCVIAGANENILNLMLWFFETILIKVLHLIEQIKMSFHLNRNLNFRHLKKGVQEYHRKLKTEYDQEMQ